MFRLSRVFALLLAVFCSLADGASPLGQAALPTYRYWLNEDVRWIITREERAAFLKLQADAERRAFVENFWSRRDPTPDTIRNEFKDEHYRRIVYVNEQFSTGVTPGWNTDRGRVYVTFGPPDKIESSHTDSAGSEFPFEIWHYRYIEGLGQEIALEFVDTCKCGDYRMTIDRSSKDALLHVPPAVIESERRKLDGDSGFHVFVGAWKPPQPRFKDLEELVTHKINLKLVPIELRADLLKVTSFTDLVPITIGIKNKNLTFVTKDGVASATVNIFGRVMAPSGWVVETFEDTLQVQTPAELLASQHDEATTYWNALALRAGQYRLDVAIKDVAGDRAGTASQELSVPAYAVGRLAASSLLLLSEISPAARIGQSIVLGGTPIRPTTEPNFQRTRPLELWMQVYGLGIDAGTQRPSATVEYHVANASGKFVLNVTEQPAGLGRQMTLKKAVDLANLAPGRYRVSVKVSDRVMNRSLLTSADFVVR